MAAPWMFPPRLTFAERVTLQLIAAGLPKRRIASVLNLPYENIRSRTDRIMWKYEARTAPQAVAIGLRMGEIK